MTAATSFLSSPAIASATSSSSGASRPSRLSRSCRPASASFTRSILSTSQRAFSLPGSATKLFTYPDTLVGTDSHTTMINGLGIVGWGVGGIEAEAGMLGQPVYASSRPKSSASTCSARCGKASPPPISRSTSPRCSARQKVVGKFVEFYGPGATSLSRARSRHHRQHGPRIWRHHGLLSRRCGIGQLPPFHGVAPPSRIELVRSLFSRPRNCSASRPRKTASLYSSDLELDLGDVVSPAWPARNARRTASRLPDLKEKVPRGTRKPVAENGFGKKDARDRTMVELTVNGNVPRPTSMQLKHGSVLIAAITSCTNTSNPSRHDRRWISWPKRRWKRG